MAPKKLSETDTSDEPGSLARAAVVSTAMTLVLAAGLVLGVWLSRSDGGGTASEAVGAGTAVTSSQQTDPGDGEAAVFPAGIKEEAGLVARSSNAQYIFIVDSTNAETTTLNRIAEENRFRSFNGLPEFDARVVVVGSDGDADAWLGVLNELDTIRHGLGLPPLEIIDLRKPDAPARAGNVPATCSGDGLLTNGPTGGMAEFYCEQQPLGIDEAVRIADDAPSIPRIYFVASADAATDVLNRIAEENRLRFANGAAERRAKVVIVNSDDHASAWIGSIQDSDAIRAELGAPSYEIIDLRTAEAIAPTTIACSGDGLTPAAPTGGTAERYCEQADDSRQEAGTSTATLAGADEGMVVYLVPDQTEVDRLN